MRGKFKFLLRPVQRAQDQLTEKSIAIDLELFELASTKT
jgi:hypothetical protein